MNIKWGNPDEEYTFISMVKVIAPSGKVVSFVTGDKANSDLAFALEEKGLYKIESEYLFDGNEYSEAVHRVWPEGETVEVAEDGSVDGFQFDKKDGNWSQCYEIVIVTSN